MNVARRLEPRGTSACPPRPRSKEPEAIATSSAAGATTRAPFVRAARHSRRVRFLRIAIPVVIVLTLGATVAGVVARSAEGSGPAADRCAAGSSSREPRSPWKRPSSAATPDRRWYELTASAAAQDITKPDLIELHDVRAKIEAEDKSSTMFLSAKDGVFNRKAGILTLNNDISLKSSSGYRDAARTKRWSIPPAERSSPTSRSRCITQQAHAERRAS